MNAALFSQTIAKLQEHGPDRILIDREGRAVPPKQAEDMGATHTVVLVRDDGWCIGATWDLAMNAFDLWKDDWFGYTYRTTPMLLPMSAFEQEVGYRV